MIRILFICHGNICRSVMAEYIMKDLLKKKCLEDIYVVESAATSREEIGNDIYPPAKRKLNEKHIAYGVHKARQVQTNEYDKWDYFIYMDQNNKRNLSYIFPEDRENKIHPLLENKDVEDPWYTGNFDITYFDLVQGCQEWIQKLEKGIC